MKQKTSWSMLVSVSEKLHIVMLLKSKVKNSKNIGWIPKAE